MQKHVNLVDLVKSFPTNIFLQNFASIQKRSGNPRKFNLLAEKSDKGSVSNLSTKIRAAFCAWARPTNNPNAFAGCCVAPLVCVGPQRRTKLCPTGGAGRPKQDPRLQAGPKQNPWLQATPGESVMPIPKAA